MLTATCASAANEGSNMPSASDQHRASTEDYPKARREPRIATAMVIEVSGFDAAGCFFTERTSTANVSENGCCFRLNAGVGPNALIALQTGGGDLSSRPAFYQVVWRETRNPGALVGAERMHGQSAWRDSFSASSDTYPRKP